MEKTGTTQHERLKSLDALRGFDMFWIMGGADLFVLLASITGLPALQWWANQMGHVAWHGFHAYDMIFPLFLFIAGVSFPFSVAKRMTESAGKRALYRHIFRRGFLLVLLGMLYNNGLSFDFAHIRYASVLGRIGLAWMFAALIFLHARQTKILFAWFAGLLLVYWLLFVIFKAPDLGDPDHFSMKGNIAGYIDRLLLPGKLCCYTFGDNEGLLPTMSATATGLSGMLAGKLLMYDAKPMKKVVWLLLAGVVCMIIGQVWNLFFPINKNLWSSSFVCWVGGLSLLLLAVFYLIIDVWKWQKWAFFFVVIGMNPITIYLAKRIIRFDQATQFFFEGMAALFPEPWRPFVLAVGFLSVAWAFLFFLYKKKIFLKV